MIRNWTNNKTMYAPAPAMRTRAICLRSGGALVSLHTSPLSIEIQKDFVDHDRGGCDG
jgi:hypothetical protein